MKTSLSALADLVLPRACVVCGRRLLLQEKHICMECLAELPETHFANFSHNPMADRFNVRIASDYYEPYAYAAALYYYAEGSGYEQISRALKYGRNFAAGRHFSVMLGRRLAASPYFADVDLVIPVPLHFTRQLSRGYNQAEVIARALVAELPGKAVCRTDLLKRTRRTRSQALTDPEQKAQNVSGAFSLKLKKAGADGSAYSHILLVDDVFTSGATLGECHRALRSFFPPSVRISAATLAYAGAAP